MCQALDQALGQFVLLHAALRLLHRISHAAIFPLALFHIQQRIRGVGIAVARLAHAARIDDPFAAVEVEAAENTAGELARTGRWRLGGCIKAIGQ